MVINNHVLCTCQIIYTNKSINPNVLILYFGRDQLCNIFGLKTNGVQIRSSSLSINNRTNIEHCLWLRNRPFQTRSGHRGTGLLVIVSFSPPWRGTGEHRTSIRARADAVFDVRSRSRWKSSNRPPSYDAENDYSPAANIVLV